MDGGLHELSSSSAQLVVLPKREIRSIVYEDQLQVFQNLEGSDNALVTRLQHP